MDSNEILVALRRIMRTVDVRSKELERDTGLTLPQILILRAVRDAGELTVTEIARRVSLSQGTVTTILQRLESKGLLKKEKHGSDRRRVGVTLTAEGSSHLARAPELFQETFISRFQALQAWEQHLLTASVQRVAHLLEADDLAAGPVLKSGDLVD